MTLASAPDVVDRFAGVLLGTAVGDALGLPMEGMRADAVARHFPLVEGYSLFGSTGFVSDDTEQTALLAQSLARHPGDRARCVSAFRFALLGWFLRLPWGIGLGTLRACLRIALGRRTSGVASAGNGAAMRAAVVGAFFFDSPSTRAEWSDDLARVTHTDERAVEGARFVAELAAQCVRPGLDGTPGDLVAAARETVRHPALREVLDRAQRLAVQGVPAASAARELGATGFIVHTIGITTYCFLRFGDAPESAIVEAIRAGGDTDSHAAIVGAWVGARHGPAGLPQRLVSRLQNGPFGRTHLRALAEDLGRARDGVASREARYSWLAAMLRNVALYPLVLMHAFRIFFTR
jgi:ADP-ribosylglycohydrolase